MTRGLKWLLIMLFGLNLLVAIPGSSVHEQKSPVARTGAYEIGLLHLELNDESRDGRQLNAYVWYPAAGNEHEPDVTGAPYPLVIFSHGFSDEAMSGEYVFIRHLVSHGFVVAGVDHDDLRDQWGMVHGLTNRPLDIIFLLNQLAKMQAGHQPVIIDMERVGMAGYSFGAYTSLSVAGARVDATFMKDWCSNTNRTMGAYCRLTYGWTEAEAYHSQFVTPSDDQLWSATIDDRIQALLLIAPCFVPLFGADGLADVTTPTLIIAGIDDEFCPYADDAVFLYQHLHSDDRYLVTQEGIDHVEILETGLAPSITAAFFGYYLQGKTEYNQYLTPDAVDNFPDVRLESAVGES